MSLSNKKRKIIMQYLPKDHTFAICAYKESSFLEDCILSLESQTVKSNIIICTSTPNAYISGLADKYGLPVLINQAQDGIASDWNFAYRKAETPLVTLAHQDDVYEPAFLEQVLAHLNQGSPTLLCFTDYYEIQDGKRVDASQFLNLRIKQILLMPLRNRCLQKSIWVRRRILSVGDPIGCPSVTYVKKHLPETIFQKRFQSNLDWQTWEMLSRLKGRFLYISQPLMGHRMCQESTTLNLIGENGVRVKEDFELLCLFWPKPVAKIICKMYVQSQKHRLKRQLKSDKS